MNAYLDIFVCVLLMSLGGFVRLIDGSGQPISYFGYPITVRVGVRNVLMTIISAISWWYVFGIDWIVLWGTFLSAWCIIIGCTQWQNAMWQWLRFSVFGAYALLFMDMVQWWPIVFIYGFGGLCYAIFFAFEHLKWPKFWIMDGPESYARIIAGATVLGGVTLGKVFDFSVLSAYILGVVSWMGL